MADQVKSPLNTDVKLPVGTRYGYGAASIADTIILDFVSAFFLFFLTDVVGINPALAGSVAFVGVLWDAITDPIIGNIADRSSAKGGKYRRFVLISILPIVVCSVLLFFKVNFGEMGAFFYYLVIAMLYYTAYTVFNIPYMALGSSLTSNEIEKTRLSGVRQSFGFAGALFSGALPAILIESFQGTGMSSGHSYTFTALVLGICSAITIFITWRTTKGYELEFPQQPKEDKKGLWETIKEIFKCKSFVLLVIAALFFFVGFTMIANGIMYTITGILGLTEGASSGLFVVLALSGIALSFLLSKVAEKVDKRTVFLVATMISVVYLLIVRFVGVHSLVDYSIYIVMANFAMSAFLVFVYNFLYDVIDIIEFKTGERDSGTIFAYYSFIIKLGKAGALQIVGLLLAVGGYVPGLAQQGPEGVSAIMNIITVWPAAAFLVCFIFIMIYPVTLKRIQALQAANALRKEGKPYTTEGFEQLL